MTSISDSVKDEVGELISTFGRIWNPINLRNLNSRVYEKNFDKYLDAMVTGGVYSIITLSVLAGYIARN